MDILEKINKYSNKLKQMGGYVIGQAVLVTGTIPIRKTSPEMINLSFWEEPIMKQVYSKPGNIIKVFKDYDGNLGYQVKFNDDETYGLELTDKNIQAGFPSRVAISSPPNDEYRNRNVIHKSPQLSEPILPSDVGRSSRGRRFRNIRNNKLGTIVRVKDDDYERAQWRLGKGYNYNVDYDDGTSDTYLAENDISYNLVVPSDTYLAENDISYDLVVPSTSTSAPETSSSASSYLASKYGIVLK